MAIEDKIIKLKGRKVDLTKIENRKLLRVFRCRIHDGEKFLFGYGDKTKEHTDYHKKEHKDYADHSEYHDHVDHTDSHSDCYEDYSDSHSECSYGDGISYGQHSDSREGHHDAHADKTK